MRWYRAKTVTLRYKARWLRGWPEALLRLNGNWLEATAAMTVPANLGHARRGQQPIWRSRQARL